MDKTILQIPITKTLKREAKLVAVSYGFSSLQDLMRVMLTKLASKQLAIQITDRPIPHSGTNEGRYRKMERDVKERKNVFTAKDVPSLMKHLNQKLYTPSLRGSASRRRRGNPDQQIRPDPPAGGRRIPFVIPSGVEGSVTSRLLRYARNDANKPNILHKS